MMPRVIDPPRGATEPLSSPRPTTCPHCDGDGVEPWEESAAIPCLACDARGCVEDETEFLLPRSRAHQLRRVHYRPSCCRAGSGAGLLKISTAAKPTHKPTTTEYQVSEFRADGCRGFAVMKVGRPDRVHCVEIGPAGVRCDCEGESYQTSAKHNQRAWERGDEVYPGYGCKHTDALVALLNGGWFDI